MIVYTDNDPFCCDVLRARVADGGLPPGDVLEKDIREVTADDLAGYEQVHLFAGIGGFGLACKLAGWEGSLLTGGFPCQDISIAGKGDGITGARSGLWSEMARLIGDLRPDNVFVENVPALLHRGMERVLGDLAEIGYDAEWHCIPASAVGAPIERDRLWIIAQPSSERVGIFAGCQSTQDFQWNVAEIAQGRTARTPWASSTGFIGCPADLVQVARGWRALDGTTKELAAIGNAIAPQVAAEILKAILQADRGLKP